MKKFITLALSLIFTATIFYAPRLYAVALYENDNQSAEFIRTLNRGAAIDVDAAYFNPAGLAMIEKDGLYFYAGNQIISQRRRITDQSNSIKLYLGSGNEVSFEGEAHTFLYPVLFVVHKKEDTAIYFHGGIIGAGASASYDRGLPGFYTLSLLSASSLLAMGGESLTAFESDNSLDAYAVFFGASAGAARRINDRLSISLGGRYIYALQESSVRMKFKTITGSGGTTLPDLQSSGYFTDVAIDTTATGYSFGIIAGLDFRPLSGLNFGLRWEYHTPMELTNGKPDRFDVPSNLRADLEEEFGKGVSTKKTLPMMVSLGASYMITERITVLAGTSYYFNRLADFGEDNGEDIAGRYENGYGLSIGAEYLLFDFIIVSAGASVSTSGMTEATRTEGEYSPDAIAFSTGFTWIVNENMSLTLGGMYAFYDEETGTSTSGNQVVAIPRTWNIAMGVRYGLF